MSKDLNNEFFWSIPRDEAFRTCHRKYYFQYYGCWEGWREDAAPRVRSLYTLSRLQTRTQWADNRIRRSIRDAVDQLRSGKPLDENVAVEQLLETLRKDFRDSRDHRYRANPKLYCGLFEHEYDIELAGDVWKSTADRAAQSVRAFHTSEVCTQLGRLPSTAWLEIEKRGGFRLNGLLVLVNPDFAFRDGSRTTLYQWTSESLDSKNRALQQGCNVFYAMDHWKAPREETAVVGFGASGTAEPPATFSAEQLDEAKDHILETADEMLFPLPDPQTNKATEEAFEISSDETPCHRCNFLKACPKWQ